MDYKNNVEKILLGVCKYLAIAIAVMALSFAVSYRTAELLNVRHPEESMSAEQSDTLKVHEERVAALEETRILLDESKSGHLLQGKKIVYDGDSIAESRENNGGGYPALIAQLTGSSFENQASGGAGLCPSVGRHCVAENLPNLPVDGDLYCFEGGINDYWRSIPLGKCDLNNYTSEVDINTICGAMETIFRYCLNNFEGKPVCFVIVHKIQNTAFEKNANGDTFEDYRNAMVMVCEKYSIPYYDAFMESGLNGWNDAQSVLFLNANSRNEPDGTHPNEEGYLRYYVPQLLDLFARIVPVD